MSITRKYKTPPLIEALCEFRFKKSDIDYTYIKEEFTKSLENDYPKKKTRKNIDIVLRKKDNETTQTLEQTEGLVQFSNNEETSLVQIGENLLAVNQLRPYDSWECFEPIVFNRLNEYIDIAKPNEIEKVSVRYINRIDLKLEKNENLTSYIKYSVLIPSGISSTLASIDIRTEHMYNNNNDVLAISFKNIKNNLPNTISLALDFTYVLLNTKNVDINNIRSRVKVAHLNMNEAFEAMITDKCREQFNI